MGFGDSHAASGGSIYHGNFTGAHFHVGDQRKDEFHEKLGVSPAMFPCYELPAKREHYIGRDNERTVIQNHLQSYRKSGSISYISIFGLGGVGKSAFALDYAWRCQAAKTYDAIFWIHAETPISTRESFASIALSLGMVISSDNPDLNVFMVKKWLEKTGGSFSSTQYF